MELKQTNKQNKTPRRECECKEKGLELKLMGVYNLVLRKSIETAKNRAQWMRMCQFNVLLVLLNEN